MSARGWVIFLSIGAVVGFGAGLLISWVIYPVQYVDTAPLSLRDDYRADYLTLIARAYAATGDLAVARERLALFPKDGDGRSLAALAQQTLAGGRSEDEARALAGLAAALASPSPGPSPAASPVPPTPTPTPTGYPPASTPRRSFTRTPTPTATPGGPLFELDEKELICRLALAAPLIQVRAFDHHGDPVPGVEFIVEWEGGRDHFFTGLKPELGPGYGDFEMTVGVVYSVRPASGGQVAGGLQTRACEDVDGQFYPGSWALTFRQR